MPSEAPEISGEQFTLEGEFSPQQIDYLAALAIELYRTPAPAAADPEQEEEHP